ncbi:MAG: low-complexity tail membrane protein [Cyanobacteria bacterium P01_H01_bin.15]
MNVFRKEPYLWVHLAGLAVLPLTLLGVWLGLAVGEPLPVVGLEPIVLFLLGVLPIFWMQWHRPFDIFSLGIVALRPNSLSLEQQKILHLFKTSRQRAITLFGAVLMMACGWLLYRWSPFAASAAEILPAWRPLGFVIATGCFLLSNLFWQVPLSVLGVLVSSEDDFTQQGIYREEQIVADFTILGWPVRQILPTLVSDSTKS